MQNFRELIERWPSVKDFAEEVKLDYQTCYSMYRRNSIAPQHWPKVIKAAKKRGFKNVTETKLVKLSSRKNDSGAPTGELGAAV